MVHFLDDLFGVALLVNVSIGFSCQWADYLVVEIIRFHKPPSILVGLNYHCFGILFGKCKFLVVNFGNSVLSEKILNFSLF